MRTRDRNLVIATDLIVGHTYEVAVVACDKWGNTQDIESAPHGVITIQGKTITPNVPTGLTATTAMYTIFLEWVNPEDADLATVEVWRSDTDTPPDPAMISTNRIAEVTGNHYADNLGASGITMYYWVRAKNASGVYSDFNAVAGVEATSGSVVASSVADYAITATKLNTNAIVLSGAIWTDNATPGQIGWNAHTLVYNGASYAISAGSTNTTYVYVYWIVGATSYSLAYTHPPLGSNTGFMIACNVGGTVELVWNSSANMVIGTAFIADLAVTNAKIAALAVDNAKINDLNAAKINAGTLSADRIAAASIVAAKLASDVISGGKIIAGLLTADNIQAGTMTGRTIQTDSTGQRTVLDVSDDTLKVFNSSNVNIIAMNANGGGSGVPGLTLGSTTTPIGAAILVQNDSVGGSPTAITFISPAFVQVAAPNGSTDITFMIKAGTNENVLIYASGIAEFVSTVKASAFKIGSNQVVGARVVDARADDAVTSTWSATEAGVLDALRDAMISHGLLAAS